MGHPVAHSRSPMLHGYWLRTLGIDGSYEFADVAPEQFEDFFGGLKRNGYAGGNITIPHKEAAFRLVDRRERAADAIGAVNTVWYEGETLIGGNTDWYGIVASLDDIDPGWDAIGAVNTVCYQGETLIGRKTYWYALGSSSDDIHPGWDGLGGRVVVLGAG